MMTLVRRGLASSMLGAFALFMAGCGGGGGGATVPTATPIGTPSASPTATTSPGGGGTPVTANQFAFVSNRANPNSDNSDIYKANLDGSNVVRLTALNQPIDKPSVSPDGSRIIFQVGDSNTSGGTNNIELAIINANGSGFQQLTNDSTPAGRPDDYNPVFSPDGQYIYWTSTRQAVNGSGGVVDGVPHIWRMRGAVGNTGIEQQQVVFEPSAYPSVDRSGKLAYIAYDPTQNLRPTAIVVSDPANPTNNKRISVSASDNPIFDLAISPDGARVAFSAANSTGSTAAAQLRIYDVASSGNTGALPSGGSSNGGSAWSRDSQRLFFDAANGGTSRRQIFSSTAPFSLTTPITLDTSSDNYSPAFLPVQ